MSLRTGLAGAEEGGVLGGGGGGCEPPALPGAWMELPTPCEVGADGPGRLEPGANRKEAW